MANDVLFAGGRLDSFKTQEGDPLESTSQAGSFDTAYADCAIRMDVNDAVETPFLDDNNAVFDAVAGDTVHFHFEWYATTATSGSMQLNRWLGVLKDASGYIWMGVRLVTGGQIALVYNSGTGPSPIYTQIGSPFVYSPNTRYEIDGKITLDAGGDHSAEFSVNKTLRASGGFTQANLTSLRYIRLESVMATTLQFSYHSQVLVTRNRSAIGGKVKYSRATGAGGNSGWTGAYTNVNEAVNSDASFDAATSAGLLQSYAMGDVTVPASYTIAAVFYSVRGKNDGVSPLNIAPVVRQSTTNYDGSNFSGIGTSFGALTAKYVQDPASAAVWTQTTFNTAEFGYLSAA